MDVKVITRHMPSNYGSLLQTLATQKVIERFGHTCSIIDYERPDERGYQAVKTALNQKEGWRSNPLKKAIYIALRYPTEALAERKFDKMRKELLHLTPLCQSTEDLSRLKADVFMTGSDQVWGPMMNGQYDKAYFLDFVREGQRVSYAGSFGKTEFTHETIEAYRKMLSRYDALTVREDAALDMLKEWGLPCKGQVLDPTLLLTADEWLQMVGEGKAPCKGQYILVYQIHNDPALNAFAKQLAARQGLPLVRVSVSLHQISRGGHLCYLPDLRGFIACIKHCRWMVTDSFHGTAFAINMNKQFVEVLPKNKTGSRNQSILRLTGLTHRIVSDVSDIQVVDTDIDYEKVNQNITKERAKSLALLKSILSI